MNQPSAEQMETLSPTSADRPQDRRELRGGWLLAARVGWVALTLGILALYAIMLPRYISELLTPCVPGPHCFYLRYTPYDEQFVRQYGITRDFMAGFQVWGNTGSMLVYIVIAAVIFLRRSSDRIALFCATALVLFGAVVFSPVLQDTLAVQSTLGAWLYGTLFTVAQSAFLIFFFLFPNGRFAPSWTRWLILPIAGYWAYDFFSDSAYSQEFNLGTLVFIMVLLSPVVAQLYRYRRVSAAAERQQTKWVVFGFTIAVVGFALFLTVGNLILPPAALQSNVITVFVAQTGFAVFLLLVPISIAIAILRSRLYDIDVLINRTLVYGSLTAILALIYIAGVIGVQNILNGFTRNASGRTSPILIVITTLLIAALFQPLRHRLQRGIDRRFYRRKYSVERTLASFSATLRQEVDLGDLRDHLLVVVQQTMEPRTLSLWLRAPDDRP